jgi:deoxynucleoside triphosphate triphosphohydrolase SAMHD1
MRRECEALFTPENIVAAARALPVILEEEELPKANAEDADDGSPELVPGTASELKPEHIIVDFSHMHHGMKDKNPLDFIKFYSKHNPNGGILYVSH